MGRNKSYLKASDLAFTDEKPPEKPPVVNEMAKIVEMLRSRPGQWAKVTGAGTKAADVHKKHADIERRKVGEDLWMRAVTPAILEAEAKAAAEEEKAGA